MNMDETSFIGKELLLLGNSFPLSLIRRRVEIKPVGVESLREELDGREVASFWGHANTLSAARQVLGRDVTPSSERPVLALTPEGLPTLQGVVFHECWILSPNYASGFRPAVGEEVKMEVVTGWQVLKITWG
jgi:hypothetical protein